VKNTHDLENNDWTIKKNLKMKQLRKPANQKILLNYIINYKRANLNKH